jgi:hypothetical protein
MLFSSFFLKKIEACLGTTLSMPPLIGTPLLMPPFSSHTQGLHQKSDLIIDTSTFLYIDSPDAAFAQPTTRGGEVPQWLCNSPGGEIFNLD